MASESSLKLVALYESLIDVGDYTASAREFRRALGRALNSLTVLKKAPLKDKEKIEPALQELSQMFNLAMEIVNELEEKEKNQPTYP